MVTAGRHTFIPQDINCYEGVDLTFGNFCSIGSGLKIYSGTHPCIEHPGVVSQFPFKEIWGADYPESKMGGSVKIGNDVWIATDVRILEGVTIGDGVIIGAGTVVGSNIPPYTIAVGNPWRVLTMRFDGKTIRKLLEIKWWNFNDEQIKEALPSMCHVNDFIRRYAR